ncbi:MAG TPA: hypothetical protein PLG97_09160, partial [Alcaligenes sp.]|nr:hypothetical protein [Alcaligenes sp.]
AALGPQRQDDRDLRLAFEDRSRVAAELEPAMLGRQQRAAGLERAGEGLEEAAVHHADVEALGGEGLRRLKFALRQQAREAASD